MVIHERTIHRRLRGPCLSQCNLNGGPCRKRWKEALTDKIIEPQQCTRELAVALHNDPYLRANTSVN